GQARTEIVVRGRGERLLDAMPIDPDERTQIFRKRAARYVDEGARGGHTELSGSRFAHAYAAGHKRSVRLQDAVDDGNGGAGYRESARIERHGHQRVFASVDDVAALHIPSIEPAGDQDTLLPVGKRAHHDLRAGKSGARRALGDGEENRPAIRQKVRQPVASLVFRLIELGKGPWRAAGRRHLQEPAT